MSNFNIKNLIISHRGIYNNLTTPENSLKAFQKSLYKKIPIEFDIHLTKDNKIVIFHDSNLKRMTGIDKKIKDCTSEEISGITLLDTNEGIPTLEDVLKLINGDVLIDIEIKDDGRLNELVNQLVKFLDNYQGKFIIQSFNIKYIFWFRKNRPNYLVGILLSNIKPFCFNNIIDSKYFLNVLKPNFLAYNKAALSCKKVQKLRKSGMTIVAWTIKTKKEKEAAGKLADSLISEYLN